MIELENVSKRYVRRGRRSYALRDVTVHIPAGAVWAVVGPNGAGKSTLLALVLGFLRPSSGTVRVATAAPRDYVRDSGAAYLPERFDLPREWKAGEALRMFARLEGGTAADADRVIAQLDLQPHTHKRAGDLSRGLLQRVGLAQALLARRRLVVLDEPTEGLDPIWRIRLRDMITALRDDGATIVIASHDLAEVERVADHALLLHEGRVRDVLATHADAPATGYLLRLAAPFDKIDEVFPGAETRAGNSYRVHVASAHELSDRIGALVGLGGVIAAVEPLRPGLEDRVRAALEEER